MKNFEKYKTAKDRAIAFDTWCKCITSGTCEGCELKDIHIECKNGLVCPLAWLDLEAEEEKPMPCPFCGDDCHLQGDAMRYVACNHCGYESRPFDWKDNPAEAEVIAIAAHNRVCKAVAAYKEGEVK